MLSKFSVKNFKSFENMVTLKLDHPTNRAKKYKDNTIYTYKDENGYKRCILNGAVVFGANASGKSNLIEAFEFLNSFIVDNEKISSFNDLDLIDFKFTSVKKDIEFNLNSFFTIPNTEIEVKSIYTLIFNPNDFNVKFESLEYQKVLKSKLDEKTIVFIREKDKISPSNNNSLIKIIDKISQDNLDYKSILNMMVNRINRKYYEYEVDTIDYKVLDMTYKEISKGFKINDDYSDINDFVEQINHDIDFKQETLNTLYDFDFGISDFGVEDITDSLIKSVQSQHKNPEISQQLSEFIKGRKNYVIKSIHNVKNKDFELPLKAESDGTKKFLKDSLNLFSSLANGYLFISDEFDSKYHIKIQEGILNKFIYQKDNSKAQFIITSHNPLLLNQKYFAKEQVYLMEKDRETQASILYSLKDFKDISYNNHNWTDMYLDGRIGAVPEVF